MQEYFDSIRARVCSVCIDGIFDSKGKFQRCGLHSDQKCPVEVYMPEVVAIVQSIESPQIEDYVSVLREKVCATCPQNVDGFCEVRS